MAGQDTGETGGPRVWDTRDVRPAEAFSYYRDGICEAFMDLAPEASADERGRFQARIESVRFGAAAVNRVTACSHAVLRTRREIARSPAQCFYLNYQAVGHCHIDQAGRAVSLRPGDVGIFDSALPFALQHGLKPKLGVYSFWIPHDALLRRLPRGLSGGPELLSSHPAVGGLIAETARTLGEQAERLPASNAARLLDILLDLTAMAVDGRHAEVEHVGSRSQAALLLLKSEAERHHADPDLNARVLAGRCGLSERWVHRLFEREGVTFRQWLLQRRLSHVARMLRDPTLARLPVNSIAMQCGFRNMSHFGRVFHEQYGQTPGAWRRAGD